MDKLAVLEARENRYLERRVRRAFAQGIFSLVAPFVGLSLIGILLGFLAIRTTRRESKGVMTPALYKRRTSARLLGIFGLIVSVLMTVFSVIAVIALFLLGVPVIVGIITTVFGFFASVITGILGIIASIISTLLPLIAPALAVALVALIEELIAKILGEGILLAILLII